MQVPNCEIEKCSTYAIRNVKECKENSLDISVVLQDPRQKYPFEAKQGQPKYHFGKSEEMFGHQVIETNCQKAQHSNDQENERQCKGACT